MKILHILNHFLPQHIAGTEMYAFNLGKVLTDKGMEVVFVIPHYGSNARDEYWIDGMRVIRYAEPSVVDRALQMGTRAPDGLKNFVAVLKNEKPLIVHFHEIAGSNGITRHHVKASKEAGFKTIITLHVSRYTAAVDNGAYADDVFDTRRAAQHFFLQKGFSKSLTKVLLPVAEVAGKWIPGLSSFGRIGTALSVPQLMKNKKLDFFELIRNCDKVIVISLWYEKLLKHYLPAGKMEFIEQGVFYPSPKRISYNHNGNQLRVLFVGRISAIKGIKLLIEAVSGLDNNKLQLDIYGDSGEDQYYIGECKKLAENAKNIAFKGRLHPEGIMDVMAGYDLLALPSTVHEMSPLVIREAFAAGIPVLASDSSGTREQIRDGENGWLFRMNDVRDLKGKLNMLISHPDKILKASEHLPMPRTFDKVGEEYDKLYRGLRVRGT